MKSKLQLLDLAICMLWILLTYYGHYYWNQITTIFLGFSIILRLAISFSLKRNEKKTWMPLLAYTASLAFIAFNIDRYKAVGEMGEYFFHVTGLEYNSYVDWIISVSIWMWIFVMPFLYYFYLLILHRLVDTRMTKEELFGSVLWNDRRAKYFCATAMLTFLSLNAGVGMHQRFCQTMCFIAPPLAYWLICRYIKVKAEDVWLVLLGAMEFWLAQGAGGILRVAVLVLSFGSIAYAVTYLYRKTRLHLLTAFAIIFIGVIQPSFSIGYNQYACINYPRKSFYYLAPYNGILYIKNTTNGEFVGLRDRYGLLVEPKYDNIRPGYITKWGWTNTFLLQKEGHTKIYDVNNNKILTSDIKPELQSR